MKEPDRRMSRSVAISPPAQDLTIWRAPAQPLTDRAAAVGRSARLGRYSRAHTSVEGVGVASNSTDVKPACLSQPRKSAFRQAAPSLV